MVTELSTEQKREIILTAAIIAGPNATDGEVSGQVTRILGLLDQGSPVSQAFKRAEERAANTTDVKGFVGEIIFVDKEESSNRPIVFLRTQVSEQAPEGIEFVRLDRLDSHNADQVKALANQALQLVGHKVGVTVAIEKMSGGNKVRILRGLEDRGAGASDIAQMDNSQGWRLIDWVNGGKDRSIAKIAPKLARLKQYQAQAS
jgi:hypothetical protein